VNLDKRLCAKRPQRLDSLRVRCRAVGVQVPAHASRA
jgi:hypothetical protein